MTREELDKTFEKHYKKLLAFARRRYGVQDAEDLVIEAYTLAAERDFSNAPFDKAFSWWVYKVRAVKSKDNDKHKTEAKGLDRFRSDPTIFLAGADVVDLPEREQVEILENYWNSLDKVQQSRERAKWEAEGDTLLPFMHRKR